MISRPADGPIGLGKLNLTLGGDLNVSAAPGKPITLVGNVNTVRGFYDYQGRRFTVLRDGKVRFEGDPINSLDPALDVSAERMIQAVTVRVNVQGRLRRPEIELTSMPPQEQADILALIIFNQPLNQLGEGQQLSLAQRAGSIAAGAVANQLTGSIANSLNLDQFEINLSPDTGSTAELTVGQQLGQNLYVKVQQGIGDNSQTNFVLEYEFSKWLRLQTNVLEGAATQQQLFQRVKSTGADLVIQLPVQIDGSRGRLKQTSTSGGIRRRWSCWAGGAGDASDGHHRQRDERLNDLDAEMEHQPRNERAHNDGNDDEQQHVRAEVQTFCRILADSVRR